MASKESQARADKFDFECTGSNDHDDTNCRKCAGMRKALADLLDEAIREARAQAYEAAAKVIDDEIALRENPDLDHMEPIDELAKQIRRLAQLRKGKT